MLPSGGSYGNYRKTLCHPHARGDAVTRRGQTTITADILIWLIPDQQPVAGLT
ncbi:MAG: hypothetical protein ACRDTD_12765 [Pseudonocardiaceae bacterium]